MKPRETDFEPGTIGEHIRKKRLILGLTQFQAAARMKVDPLTVLNWEKNRTTPPARAVPGVIRFLGYDPFPQPHSIGEKLRAWRQAAGLSITEAATGQGVDATTWGNWERGAIILFRRHRLLVAQLLELAGEAITQEMKVRWDDAHRKQRTDSE